jgi:hypothetical protein
MWLEIFEERQRFVEVRRQCVAVRGRGSNFGQECLRPLQNADEQCVVRLELTSACLPLDEGKLPLLEHPTLGALVLEMTCCDLRNRAFCRRLDCVHLGLGVLLDLLHSTLCLVFEPRDEVWQSHDASSSFDPI